MANFEREMNDFEFEILIACTSDVLRTRCSLCVYICMRPGIREEMSCEIYINLCELLYEKVT